MKENSMAKSAVAALKKALEDKKVDKFDVGTVIRWKSADRFVYVTIKTNAGWFTSARTGNVYVDSKLEYEELVEILARSESSDIEIATAWEAL